MAMFEIEREEDGVWIVSGRNTGFSTASGSLVRGIRSVSEHVVDNRELAEQWLHKAIVKELDNRPVDPDLDAYPELDPDLPCRRRLAGGLRKMWSDVERLGPQIALINKQLLQQIRPKKEEPALSPSATIRAILDNLEPMVIDLFRYVDLDSDDIDLIKHFLRIHEAVKGAKTVAGNIDLVRAADIDPENDAA